MDKNGDNENGERRVGADERDINFNAEYVPTKCRVTKPPPPKPATNPLQFIKVAPSALFQKVHEQIKRVEEIKKERKEVREEAEDWQQNLDNWKSSRRKRQEHIIERVVEVKKLEQEGQDKTRRKSKTFNEMMEERSKGRHKFNIPIYDDDSNDLSDYGIGSSSSKANSVKDVDTDDNSSMLDDKERAFDWSNSNNNKDNLSTPNQSQSEDEISNNPPAAIDNAEPPSTVDKSTDLNDNTERYTYEGAIEDYRSRIIKSKIRTDDSRFNPDHFAKSREPTEGRQAVAVPKGQICKRKELFEGEKPIEIRNYESPTSRRLSEDFVHTQSIKQRLRCLEECAADKKVKERERSSAVRERLEKVNNSQNDTKTGGGFIPKISNYLDQRGQHSSSIDKEERCASPETDLYMDKLNMFSKDLDLMYKKNNSNNISNENDNGLDEYSNYAPSTSSTEITDRDDSGIHTADVSCSVSQADEPIEDSQLLALAMIPSSIDKLANDDHNDDDNHNDGDNDDDDRNDDGTVAPDQFVSSTEIQIGSDSNLTAHSPRDVTNVSAGGGGGAVVSESSVSEVFAVYENFKFDSAFPLSPPTQKEPPKVKPPPPPPPVDEDGGEIGVDRIKREMHIKRSSFLGLDESTKDQICPEITVNKPPDVDSFLREESKLERSLYKKVQEETRMGVLSKVESHDSGLDIDRGRLSSDTWCTGSVGDSATPSPERQGSERTNSVTSEEDEITKKEREIIETIEKEEKSRDGVVEYDDSPHISRNKPNPSLNDPYLGSRNYFPKQPDYADRGQDSEVLKVEHELLQLEREELERQLENRHFKETRMKARLQNSRHSTENLYQGAHRPYQDAPFSHLQNVPVEYRKSSSDVPNAFKTTNVYRVSDVDPDVQYRKSMPDIQRQDQYHKSVGEYRKSAAESKSAAFAVDHRKSMPDLQLSSSPRRQPSILPGKPLRSPSKERPMMADPGKSDPSSLNSMGANGNQGKHRQLSRYSLQNLSTTPNWIQPKANPQTKSYNQHWLYQEAEIRRLSEAEARRPKQERKALPDAVIQTLHERMQSRELHNPAMKSPSKEGAGGGVLAMKPHLYVGQNQTVKHALPLPSMPYASQMVPEESQDRMLSVSGKKKCSFCSNELGRGAAMIIESLCLFYHMKCFKCCVCHTQLGDGLNGTDVRVRNQKLHCQNCYSSDDGIKFSCV